MQTSSPDKVEIAAIGYRLDLVVHCSLNAEVMWFVSVTDGYVEKARLIFRQAFSANPCSEPIYSL